MTLSTVVNPYQPIVGLTGIGLNQGLLYIGVDGSDPEVSPQACYWDDQGATAAAQPIDIIGGYPMRLGSPARLYTGPLYSIRVRDRSGAQVFYEAHAVASPPPSSGAYASIAAAQAANIPAAIRAVGLALLGYRAVGDGGRAYYIYSTVQAAGLGKFQSADGAWWELNENLPNIRMFGAVGDGSTNDSAAIQAAIDYGFAKGGAVILCPPGTYSCNVKLKSGVILQSASGPSHYGYLASGSVKQTVFQQAAAGWVVDTDAGIGQAAVAGINFQGLGAGTAGGGVRIATGNWCAVKACYFGNFADQGLRVEGTATTVEDILAVNCVMNRTRTGRIGCVEILGNDCFLSRCEATPSLTTGVSSSNLYICAIMVGGSNHFISDCVAEFADVGYYITGLASRFTGARADRNEAHGWVIEGSQTTLSSCESINNGRAVDNTYDDFHITNGSNSLAACRVFSDDTNRTRYGFYDSTAFAGAISRNEYHGCSGGGPRTRMFSTDSFAGSGIAKSPHVVYPADGTVTPDVGATSVISLRQYLATTTITDFINGNLGDTLTVFGDANVTIQNNAQIATNTGADVVLVDGKIYKFTAFAAGAVTKWYQH